MLHQEVLEALDLAGISNCFLKLRHKNKKTMQYETELMLEAAIAP